MGTSRALSRHRCRRHKRQFQPSLNSTQTSTSLLRREKTALQPIALRGRQLTLAHPKRHRLRFKNILTSTDGGGGLRRWLSEVHTANSGLERPNAMGGQNPITPWEAHLRDRFIHGVRPEIIRKRKRSLSLQSSYKWRSWRHIKRKAAAEGEVDGGEEEGDVEELTLVSYVAKLDTGRGIALIIRTHSAIDWRGS
ncbi:unnamed protein product [Pleuronectes platessa]|uniref:Uncharacterized protein n=1 Tax=Pleuronectes platessa TaxID=8262 RepID=A0A9N7UG74_PLEPL|nr:unnamed protein product [Pleuronectes platessa]